MEAALFSVEALQRSYLDAVWWSNLASKQAVLESGALTHCCCRAKQAWVASYTTYIKQRYKRLSVLTLNSVRQDCNSQACCLTLALPSCENFDRSRKSMEEEAFPAREEGDERLRCYTYTKQKRRES